MIRPMRVIRAAEVAGAALAASREVAAGGGSTTSDSCHLSPEDVSMSAAVGAQFIAE